MKKIISLSVIALSISLSAQTYKSFGREIFFGHLPSAKTEAMGRIVTLNYDPYFVSHSNPANLVTTNGVAIFYSKASPYYFTYDATYNYAGISYINPTVGAFAINYLNLEMVENIPQSPGGPDPIGSFEENRLLYTLTYSYAIPNWFSFGINANLFVDNSVEDQSFTGTFFELGLSRNFNLIHDLPIKDDLTVATQLKNIFNQSFAYNDETPARALPSIFRFGLSNTIEYIDIDGDKESYLFGFTIGFEYQDLFNSKHRTVHKVGSELSLLDILFLRGGYYRESSIEYGFYSTLKIEEFTYGAGLKLDFEQLFEENFPVIVRFDYVNSKQPTYITSFDDRDNFTTFTLIANYRLN